MVDTSFSIPSFPFPKDESEDKNNEENNEENVESLGAYLKIIDDYDKKIEELTNENVQLRFDNGRMKLALELISTYIGSLK